jgi:hypothetical protein
MKFTLIAGLLGAASAVDAEPVDDKLVQEAAEMEQQCQNMDIDEESLLELDQSKEADNIDLDTTRYHKNVKHSHKTHYSKSKHQINRENHHILST